MSEFNKWQEYKALSDSEFYIAKESWDYQQAKIDDSENTRAVLYRENIDIREKNADLQTKINELQEQLRIEREQGTEYFTDTHSLIAERDELQARVDRALNILCKLQYSSGERIYNDVGNILKGNKDEN